MFPILEWYIVHCLCYDMFGHARKCRIIPLSNSQIYDLSSFECCAMRFSKSMASFNVKMLLCILFEITQVRENICIEECSQRSPRFTMFPEGPMSVPKIYTNLVIYVGPITYAH